MGLGCFAVPIVIILVLAVLGFAVAAIFNGIAAAEMGGALLMIQIMQPVIALLGIGAGVGLVLAVPALLRTWAQIKDRADKPGKLGEADEPVKALPATPIHQLPAPRSYTVRRRVMCRPRIRVDMDRLLK